MNKRLTDFVVVSLAMTVILWSIPARALNIEVIPSDNNFQFFLMNIRPADTIGRHFTLDRETGTITFGEGPEGLRPPTGQGVVATYRSGTGQTGNVYPITLDFHPFLIPLEAFSEDDTGKPDLSFVIAGLAALVLETSYSGVLVQKAEVVPVPATVWLLNSGLLGLAGWRRFRKG